MQRFGPQRSFPTSSDRPQWETLTQSDGRAGPQIKSNPIKSNPIKSPEQIQSHQIHSLGDHDNADAHATLTAVTKSISATMAPSTAR
jgi:hypothetical protein